MTPDIWQDYDAARAAAECAYEAARKPIDKAPTLIAALQAAASCSPELDALWRTYKAAMAAHPAYDRPGHKARCYGAKPELVAA